ncbi:hypothetical protein OCU04_002904 [Sclerotinia nivalis]|uniref:Uncharacterized protein n=1 Tax=Sclerotinia nivalis TaxID=352851 RepID=A0A9X0AY01_9HELO|nr:hypothetical protein OCU04_002904 [Sclerotinia nivalis]
MPFEFINNAVIGPAARKRIRSHVAVGRNVGKKLVRTSRKRSIGIRREITLAAVHLSNAQDVAGRLGCKYTREDTIDEIERHVGDSISVLSFPDHVVRNKRIIQRAFSFISSVGHPPELNNALITPHASTSIFVQFMVLDEACLHCGVAVSITALNNLIINQEDPKTAMHHLSRAFRLINDKLSGNDAVADTTIAVVLTMSHYYRLQGQFRQGLVHLQKLEKMVEMRGGIASLEKEQFTLAQKIFRADLEYSLHLGTSLRYTVQDIESNNSFFIRKTDHSHFYGRQVISSAQGNLQLSTDLRVLLTDIAYFAWLLNEAIVGRGPPLDSYKLHNTLLLLGYRLISMYPLGVLRPNNPLEDAIHLGLTSFVTTFIRGLDGKVPDNPLLAGLIKSSAQKLSGNKHWHSDVLLWLLFIEKSSVLRNADNTWLAQKISQTMHAIGLQCWFDIQRILEGFPWIGALHDKEGTALVNSMKESLSDNLVISRPTTKFPHQLP